MRRLLLALACLMAVLATPAAAAQRLALVIGNAAYANHPLATAAADAGLVAQALAQAGYAVTAARDLDGKSVRATLHAFSDTARDAGPDATILVYLAGYGAQYDGNNYMVPVDAALAHDDDVPLQCADLGDLVRDLAAAPAKARILLFDLSRESPLATTDEMPLAPGLALVAPPADTLIGFAAAPGQVAPAAPLPYGPYARALAEALGPQKDGLPGLGAGATLERVRLRVATLTDGAQIPWNAGVLSTDMAPASALETAPGGTRAPEDAFAAVLARDSLEGYADFLRVVPDGPLAARARVLLALRREAATWRAVAGSQDPRAAWTYMRRYPRGPHRFDARRRLAALKAQLEPPPRFDPVAFPDVPPPGPGELPLVAHPRAALRGLPPMPAPPPALLPPAEAAYEDALPPPVPAPRNLLPIAIPLPQAAAIEPGKITQDGPDGETTTETYVAPDGASTLTLASDKGTLLIFATRTEPDGARVSVETGPKGDVKSRTTITRVGSATTIVLSNTAGAALMRLEARADPDGGRTTRVTDGDGTALATWRRDAAGVVVASESSGSPARAPAAAAPVPAAPTSPTVAVPVLPKPPLHPPAARQQVPTVTSPAPEAPARSPAPPAAPQPPPATTEKSQAPAALQPTTPVVPSAAPPAASSPSSYSPSTPSPSTPLPPVRPTGGEAAPHDRKPGRTANRRRAAPPPKAKGHARTAPRSRKTLPHHRGRGSR